MTQPVSRFNKNIHLKPSNTVIYDLSYTWLIVPDAAADSAGASVAAAELC